MHCVIIDNRSENAESTNYMAKLEIQFSSVDNFIKFDYFKIVAHILFAVEDVLPKDLEPMLVKHGLFIMYLIMYPHPKINHYCTEIEPTLFKPIILRIQ